MKIVPEIVANIADSDILNEYMMQLSRMRKNAARALEKITDENIEDIVISKDLEENIWFDLLVKEYAILEKSKVNYEKNAKTKIKRLTDENKKIKKNLKDIKNSRSYKMGRVITFIPRKMRTVSSILKKRGIKGFIKEFLWKFAPEFYMKKFTKVSIIIPVYNGQKYLRDCLNSLIKQTLKDIEIICVDDQSTDDSMNILNDYVKKDRRVRVFEQDHLGAGSARNIGIKEARGKYLLFLDCDDVFSQDLCKFAYKKAEDKKAQIVLYATQRKDMQSGKTEKMGWVLRSEELPKNKVFSGRDIPERFFQITSNCPWSKMFRKDFVLKNGLEFQNTKHANDVYFVRTAMALADRMIVLNKVLATYRYNTGESTQSLKDSAPLEFYKAFSAVKEKLQKENLFELYQKSFVNWTLTECLFNYNTMKTEEAKTIIKEKLMNEGFEYLCIKDCKKEDIYNSNLYEQYEDFIQE